MAYCETASHINKDSGSWAALKLAAHVKRCLLCKLIKADSEGGITAEMVNKHRLTVVEKPRDAWTGLPSRTVVEYEGQLLPFHK